VHQLQLKVCSWRALELPRTGARVSLGLTSGCCLCQAQRAHWDVVIEDVRLHLKDKPQEEWQDDRRLADFRKGLKFSPPEMPTFNIVKCTGAFWRATWAPHAAAPQMAGTEFSVPCPLQWCTKTPALAAPAARAARARSASRPTVAPVATRTRVTPRLSSLALLLAVNTVRPAGCPPWHPAVGPSIWPLCSSA